MFIDKLLLFKGAAMALDDTEREYIREVATNCAGVVSKQVITDVLKWHVDSCPHGKSIIASNIASKWGLIGWCLGSGISGGTIATIFIKMFAG